MFNFRKKDKDVELVLPEHLTKEEKAAAYAELGVEPLTELDKELEGVL